MDLNVKGVFNTTRVAAECMVARGKGVILSTSSMVSISGQPSGFAYPASKFAVKMCIRDRNIVAVEKDDFALKAYLSYNYPQWEVVEYETSDAAVKAMQKGETDCIAVSYTHLQQVRLHLLLLWVS